MPELSVSEFSSICVASGSPKTTKIRKIANRDAYAFYKDYYLPLRTAIKSIFTRKRHISYLYEICRKQTPSSKKVNYEIIANNFRDWQSGKSIQAFTPPRDTFSYSNTNINCNPELNVTINGQPRLVKLHFNSSDKMTQERANIICTLISEAVEDFDYEYSVLDLTTGREYFLNIDYEKVLARTYHEIENIEKMWDSA